MQKSFHSVLPQGFHQVSLRLHKYVCLTEISKAWKNMWKLFKMNFDCSLESEELGRKKRNLPYCEKRLQLINFVSLLVFPSMTISLDIEQIVLDRASVYNKGLNTLSVTKQEFPKYQALPNPRYQTESLKREINKNLFANADSLVNRNVFCSRIRISKMHTSFLDGVETRALLSDFAQQLRRKNADNPHSYFTLLNDAAISPTLSLNQNVWAKKRMKWVLFGIWTQEAAQIVHTGF